MDEEETESFSYVSIKRQNLGGFKFREIGKAIVQSVHPAKNRVNVCQFCEKGLIFRLTSIHLLSTFYTMIAYLPCKSGNLFFLINEAGMWIEQQRIFI